MIRLQNPKQFQSIPHKKPFPIDPKMSPLQIDNSLVDLLIQAIFTE